MFICTEDEWQLWLLLQTGSGKTHTVIGDLNNPDLCGIVPRAVQQIFHGEETSSKYSCTVSVSAVEIYCERVRDLLSFSSGSDDLKVIQVQTLLPFQWLPIPSCNCKLQSTTDDTIFDDTKAHYCLQHSCARHEQSWTQLLVLGAGQFKNVSTARRLKQESWTLDLTCWLIYSFDRTMIYMTVVFILQICGCLAWWTIPKPLRIDSCMCRHTPVW